ncbi:MAG: hypothetical protein DRN04_12980, partial [Thermoprotei archaeon]
VFKVISSEHLKEILFRFVVGDICFLIFKARDKELYDYYKENLEELSANIEHPLNFIKVYPRKMEKKQKRIFTELAWGLSPEDINFEAIFRGSSRPRGTTLDDLNVYCENVHKNYLRVLEREKSGIYLDATLRHEGLESDLHRQIKVFIVKLLAEKYGLRTKEEIEEKIWTEKKIDGATPDVYDTIEGEAYEVETLFHEDNEGRKPRDKINETIRKYEKTSIEKINIVLDNLTFLLHVRDLWEIKKNIRGWEQKTGKSVEFFTLDLKNHKLMPLSEFLQKAKELIGCENVLVSSF